MKKLGIINIFICFSLTSIIYCCITSKRAIPDANIGNIEIEIRVIIGKDSLARTPDGNLIGRIDKEGSIYDMVGNKIGRRKPTNKELIRQAGY
jgi:hypothetical protein